MRRVWVIFLALLFQINWSFGCDFCSVYMGIRPNDFNHSISVLHRSRLLEGYVSENNFPVKHLGHDLENQPTGVVREIYNVYELRGQYFFTPKLLALVSLPYNNGYRSIDGVTQSDIYGLGDPTVLLNYRVLNTKCDADTIDFVQRLTLGGGVKFPLGRTDLNYQNERVDIDLQPGTGSLDLLWNAEYMARYRKWGINANLIYKYNSSNAALYRYGATYNASSNLFCLLSANSVTYIPSVGLYYEAAGEDRENNEQVVGTGGSVTYFSVGTNLVVHRFDLGGYFQNEINSVSNGSPVLNKNRLVLQFTYNFLQ